ncbi:MAG: nucleotidyltransferase family protein [Chlorobi bacterium]|nr:nucleotidyltransferase family protein [Chlorobiota bacterium]
MKAMIFAAGLGSRLKPITNKIPKALVKIGDRVLLEIIIKKLIDSGFDSIIINVHHFANQIIDYLQEHSNFNIEIVISDESEELLDSGGGLKKASWFFTENEPVLLHNVDVLSDIDLSKMLEYHKKSGSVATLAVRNRETKRYFLFDKNMQLKGWKNKSAGEIKYVNEVSETFQELAFSGIHFIEPELLNLITGEGKFSIIDEYLKIAKHTKIVGYDHSHTKWLDVGKPESLKGAVNLLRQLNRK